MSGHSRRSLDILVLQVVPILLLVGFALAQGLQSSPYSASSMVRGQQGPGPFMPPVPPGAPANPFGGGGCPPPIHVFEPYSAKPRSYAVSSQSSIRGAVQLGK